MKRILTSFITMMFLFVSCEKETRVLTVEDSIDVITDVKATPGPKKITLTWKNPTGVNLSHIEIIYNDIQGKPVTINVEPTGENGRCVVLGSENETLNFTLTPVSKKGLRAASASVSCVSKITERYDDLLATITMTPYEHLGAKVTWSNPANTVGTVVVRYRDAETRFDAANATEGVIDRLAEEFTDFSVIVVNETDSSSYDKSFAFTPVDRTKELAELQTILASLQIIDAANRIDLKWENPKKFDGMLILAYNSEEKVYDIQELSSSITALPKGDYQFSAIVKSASSTSQTNPRSFNINIKNRIIVQDFGFSAGTRVTITENTVAGVKEYTIVNTGSDPYCYAGAIITDIRAGMQITVKMEYKCSHNTANVQFFFAKPNAAGGISTPENLNFPQAGDWTIWEIDITDWSKQFDWGNVGHRIRFDSGNQSDVRFDIRNFQIIAEFGLE
jgi:hypothetical protein